jgi:tetratricopeptide (TPR) repeat protein
MKMRSRVLAIAALVPVLCGCAKVQAKAAFKDGNKDYKEENYKKAIVDYEKATKLDPSMAEAWFYLGSSHQALYRPGKEGAENKDHLDKAIEYFKKSLDMNKATDERLKKVKLNTLAALTSIYSDDPYRNFDEANKYAEQLIQENPNDPKNLYAKANLMEKFGKIDEAETTYKRVTELNPNDPKACGALAAFYNKPLWEGRSKFDLAIEVLQRCASLAPNDPSGYQKLATFFWDKAYRDPLLSDEQKDQYADKGLEVVDKALALKADYFEAVIFKGLLYRVKANVAKNPALKQQYLDQALALQKQGLEMKKAAAAEEEAAAAAAAASPAPGK